MHVQEIEKLLFQIQLLPSSKEKQQQKTIQCFLSPQLRRLATTQGLSYCSTVGTQRVSTYVLHLPFTVQVMLQFGYIWSPLLHPCTQEESISKHCHAAPIHYVSFMQKSHKIWLIHALDFSSYLTTKYCKIFYANIAIASFGTKLNLSACGCDNSLLH